MMLGFGWALLDAQTGENRPHSHLAHQISLSLVDSCSINADRDLRLSPGEAVLIPATTVHRLTPSGAILRNLYVDPFFMGTRDLNKSVGLERLSTAEANALALVGSGNEARKWMEGFLNRKGSNQIDPRLRSTLQRIEPGASPSELAKAVFRPRGCGKLRFEILECRRPSSCNGCKFSVPSKVSTSLIV